VAVVITRSERLAVLKDRADRQGSEAGDLAEALQLAKEAHQECSDLQVRLAEAEGWRALIQENTHQLQRSSALYDGLERLLKPLSEKEAAKAKFYQMMANPKVFLPLVVLVILLIAAFIGIVSFEPITLDIPLGG
jgi:lipopolysaccharide export LptBFGC system permease protein LptF